MTEGPDDNDNASCATGQKQLAGKSRTVDGGNQNKPVNKSSASMGASAIANDNQSDDASLS